MLHKIEQLCSPKNQLYLETLYKAIFSASYYGLLRIGEVMMGPHVLRASNVHIGLNKTKILFVLHTSKTHTKGDLPQLIKISSVQKLSTSSRIDPNKFCPFTLLQQYILIQPTAISTNEQFFEFSDWTPVMPHHARHFLRHVINMKGLDASLYNFHSLRTGRGSDLVKLGLSVESIKKLGRWKSNAVFRYLQT